MSNLPALPVGPSRQDVDQMRKLREIMNGGANNSKQQVHEGVHSGGSYVRNSPPPVAPYTPRHDHQADVKNMKDILSKFYESQGMTTAPVSENVEPRVAISESASTSPNYVSRTIVTETASGKERRTYSVFDKNTKTEIFENISNKESSESITKFLNRGLSISSTKVQEIVELEEEFNKYRLEAVKMKKHHSRCVELGESEAGAVFSKKFKLARANALAAQESIRSIHESII